MDQTGPKLSSFVAEIAYVTDHFITSVKTLKILRKLTAAKSAAVGLAP